MTELQKQWLRRILAGGVVGGGLLLLLSGLFNMIAFGGIISTPGYPFSLLNSRMREAFSSPALAVLLEVGLAFGTGAAVGVATLPFDDYGPALARRSLLHFAVTGALLLSLGRVCFWYEEPAGGALLFGLYTFLYLVVWLVRWCAWRAELSDLRAALNLPEPARSPLKWRACLPHVLMAAGFFLLLRPLAEPFDAPDVPVLLGILLPWLAYPLVAAVTGWAAGRTLGVTPLVPITVFLAFLPNLLYPHVPYNWRQGAVYAGMALAGNLLGAAWRRMRERRE